ncbi:MULTISPECIES: ABC transporter substrate-binding protein [unclassified Oceanispirochaeta]|uniref:ABC transporter substrate-binding protein n=1 Tax=unclassified Oceanispirochaeta TaxID=2635722 RepID=UPI000E08DE82|nr:MULTISPECIES: ABC transporter substrate-binding protein [unclassified Oceanispirochaeta]MBF9017590.1 carbohydrate ABC transporter substrate-binding protein [Oceanispirochaeta sp. M2]NPD74162.1 carbohydrate ABC transporter substrate-binding protein [Oceanispirochaeta sp. M1]RDG29976.1 carbohydrate ABC transporter substrate-binding protein [Oceanispirochaeta sp. M1]
MKKFLTLSIVFLFTIGMVYASGNADSGSSGTSEKDNVTLTFIGSQNWLNKGTTVDSDLNKKFTEETGIKIDMQVIPDDQYSNVLKTKMVSGEIPDIFMVGAGAGALKYFPDEYFADLSDEAWVYRYQQYAKQGTTYQDKVMGFMTWSVDGWGILYNTEMFEEYNLTPPRTFEEFKVVCDTFQADGIVPVHMLGKEAWYWGIWFSQFGPLANAAEAGLYDKLNSNKARFADVKLFETALSQFKESYDNGYFGSDALSNAWDSGYEAMGTGTSPMILMYQSYQTEVAAKYPDSEADKWKMFPIPFAGNNIYSHSAGGIMRVAYKDSENLDSVKAYFDFLSRTDNLELFYSERTDIQANPAFIDVAAVPTEAGKSMSEFTEGKSDVEMEYGILYWDNTLFGKYIQELMLDMKTPIQVLEEIDKNRVKIFKAIEE